MQILWELCDLIRASGWECPCAREIGMRGDICMNFVLVSQKTTH